MFPACCFFQRTYMALPFLDILLKNKWPDHHRYLPQTNTQQYIHFKSHHPKNCIKSIPDTFACRIHTITTDKNLKKKPHLKELHTTLHQRGYPTMLINKGLELAEKISQRELRNPKKQQETSSIHRSLQQK